MYLFEIWTLHSWVLKNSMIIWSKFILLILNNKEPENPVVYLSNLIKRLDVKNRNGLVALAIVNLLVILLFKFYLKGSGLLSWMCLRLLLSVFKLFS